MRSALVLNFFPAFTPPSSGGELRLGMFYRALSRSHDVTILTSTDFGARFEEIVHTPRLREFRFPKDDLWRCAYATLERSGLQGELSGLAFALAVSEPTCELRQQAHFLASRVDAVIHEFPFSEPIFADGCPCPEIYNSHNFEAALLSSVVRGDGFEKALLKLIRLEGNLVGRAQYVFAASSDDAEKFRLFYGVDGSKIGLCPNGIDQHYLMPIATARKKRGLRVEGKPKLFFIGSAHYPNVEAAEFLVNIAINLSDCEIVLAGGVCKALSNLVLPDNLTLLDLIDPMAKSRILTEVDLFVNPVVLGSGTSLKALEALGAAVPMVSTPEGIRGLKLEPGVHCEVVARKEFVPAIRRMLLDAGRCETMAAAGLAVAHGEYSWDRIAADFIMQIAESEPRTDIERSLVLALNDYSILQTASGGIARLRGLLTHLDCDVVLLSFGTRFDVVLIEAGVLHATIPKTPAHRAFEDAVNEGEINSVNDGVASLFVSSNQALTELACTFARRSEAVIFEHPYMAPVLDAISAVRPDLPVIYSAHNVEAIHKKQQLRKHRIGSILTSFISDLERRLIAQAHLVVCCTEADGAHFASSGVKTVIVPNGSVLPNEDVLAKARQRSQEEAQPRIGFIGSSHGPNVEAAMFIVRELAPNMPFARFELIGSVCTALTAPLAKNVVLHGVVDELTKTLVMGGWAIALNPVESGGGSSLKLPDYMGHALATLSTPAGSRGFLLEEHQAGQVVERRQFCATLERMLGDREIRLRQQANARRYAAEHLSWDAAVVVYLQELRTLLKPPSATPRAPRLLVVTYRYTEPSLGGAEEYLIEVVKRLRTRFARLDLAAIDIDKLTNQNHFGCRMSVLPGGASRRLSQFFDRTHFFRADELPNGECLTRARNLQRTWAHEERILFAPFVAELSVHGRLRLFAGFFGPENHNGVVRRWSSPEFSFLAPPQARSLHISGYAATTKQFSMTLAQVAANGDVNVLAQYRQSIPPHFSMTVALPKTRSDRPLLLSCKVDEHDVLGDHRPLGVLLHSASVVLDDFGALDHSFLGIAALRESAADLSEQHDEELRVDQFDRWVSTLHDIALQRDAATEADFSAVRGPHSRALQVWLATHAQEYDAVLVQGIPFDVIPSTVETLNRLNQRPRVVTLPHFHGDDRFYHWRRFFESFSAADATLLFSSSIVERLKSADRCLVVVPGGGIRADEHGDPMAERSFRTIHGHANPYFLVLGRKTASKGYEHVVRAHQALRKSGTDIDLILIGPDEDGRKIDSEGVHYLGRQPRDVIRGALGSTLR